MRLITLLLLTLLSCTLPPGEKRHYLVSDECCSKVDGQGKCLQELIPGCYSDAAPLFKETFLKPDECCERWGRNGVCYKEAIAGCSQKKN